MRRICVILAAAIGMVAVSCTAAPVPDPGATTTTTPTSTTPTTPSPFPAAELVSVQPAGDAPLGWQGAAPSVSSDGRFVSFSRDGSCGPVLRDRLAGSSRAFFTDDADGFCKVQKPNLGISSSGQRLLVSAVGAQCPGTNSPVYTPKTYAYSVVDVPSNTVLTPIACNDLAYYSNSIGLTTGNSGSPLPAATTIGHITAATLSGDGTSIVVLRQLSDTTFGPISSTTCLPGPQCYGPTSYHYRLVIDRIPVAGGPTTRVGTLFDGGIVSTPGGSQFVYPNLPNVELGSANMDGTVVTLSTDAALTAADVNGRPDAYVLSAATNSLLPVVPSAAGTALGAMSSNGRFVVFSSGASDLVAGDTNGYIDLFVLDRQTGGVDRVSVGTGGTQANRPTAAGQTSVSDDGRFVAFGTDASTIGCSGQYATHFVRDRTLNRTRAPFHRLSGAPATVSTAEGSAFSYTFTQVTGAVRLSADGSTTIGVSTDWIGTAAADPGISAARVWTVPTVQAVPDC